MSWAQVREDTHAHTHTHVAIHTCTRTHRHLSTHRHLNTQMHIYRSMECMLACMCLCVHTHILTSWTNEFQETWHISQRLVHTWYINLYCITLSIASPKIHFCAFSYIVTLLCIIMTGFEESWLTHTQKQDTLFFTILRMIAT